MHDPLAAFATDAPAHRWREPTRSQASRRPSDKPNAAVRPVIVTTSDNRELLCESDLEAKAALVLMARPDCALLHEQRPFTYLDHEGVRRTHVFDLVMTLLSGVKIAIAVKPAKIAERRGLHELLRLIAGQMDPAFAAGVLLLTDAMLSRIDVANARLIHDSRRQPTPEIDRRVHETIETLNGATSIASIVRMASLDGHDQGFYAVVRAIGAGLIAPAEAGVINRDTLVRRPPDRGPP